MSVTDNELRGVILRAAYRKRREGNFQWTTEDFANESIDFDGDDLFRICDQLYEHGLIEWNSVSDGIKTVAGMAKISAFGVDVIEGHAKSPISISLDQSKHITVHSSSHVQIGDNNTQDISIEIGKIISAIDSSNASEAAKAEAKSLLKKFLEHPLLTSLAGGLASTL